MPENNFDKVMELVHRNDALRILTGASSHTSRSNKGSLQQMAREATSMEHEINHETFETAPRASTMDIDDIPTTGQRRVSFNKSVKVKDYDPVQTLDSFEMHIGSTAQQPVIIDSSSDSSMEGDATSDPSATLTKEIEHRFPETATTEIRISCGVTVFHAHKAKLMDVPYFVDIMARRSGEGNADTIDLSDFDPAAVEVVLLHAYGAKYAPTVAKQCNHPSSTNVIEIRTDGMKNEGIMKMTMADYHTPTIEMQRWRATRNFHKAGIAMHKMQHSVDRRVAVHFCKELYMHAGVYILADGLRWKELKERAEKSIINLLPDCWASETVLDTYNLLLQHTLPDQTSMVEQTFLVNLVHKLAEQVSFFRFSQKFKDLILAYPGVAQTMLLQYAELGFVHGPVDYSAYCPQYTCRCNVQLTKETCCKWQCTKCEKPGVLDARTLVR